MTDVKSLRRAKNELVAAGYPVDGLRRLVAQYYRRGRYPLPSSDHNLYLVMPSTSGRNLIPSELARRLMIDFAGEAMMNFARPMAMRESKHKGTFVAKLLDPVRFEITADLTFVSGRNLIIVDDVLNTGESSTALLRALRLEGINVSRIAVLGFSDRRQVTRRDLERFSTKLATLTGVPYDQVLSCAEATFDGAFKQWLNKAELAISNRTVSTNVRNAELIYEYIRHQAQTFSRD